MFDREIIYAPKEELVRWLSEEVGTAGAGYFQSKKEGGLGLFQVPEEYGALLCLLKPLPCLRYLELGIANGASFLLNTFFLQPLIEASWVDNLSYGHNLERDIQPKLDFLQGLRPHLSINGHVTTTDAFFAANQQKFDCIFIDADHSYEGVMKDYENSLKTIQEGGTIIFHDINSMCAPGVVQAWKEVKQKHTTEEIVFSQTCGIGVITL